MRCRVYLRGGRGIRPIAPFVEDGRLVLNVETELRHTEDIAGAAPPRGLHNV